MKKIVLLTIGLMAVGLTFVWSAQAGISTKKHTFSGVITDVRFGDPLVEPYFVQAKFDVIDQRKVTETFEVNNHTIIHDKNWAKVYVVSLRQGIRVDVQYRQRKDGVNEARLIYLKE